MPNGDLKINIRQKAMSRQAVPKVRYFCSHRGEVSWDVTASWLDARDAASWGIHAYILIPELKIDMVRCTIEFQSYFHK